MNQPSTPFQQKWVTKLLGFDYEIQFKQEVDNVVANVLSRIPSFTTLLEPPLEKLVECIAITYPYYGWLYELRKELEHDAWIIQKMQEVLHLSQDLATDAQSSHYTIDNSLLKYKSRRAISPTST